MTKYVPDDWRPQTYNEFFEKIAEVFFTAKTTYMQTTRKTNLEILMDLLEKCFLTRWLANILWRKWREEQHQKDLKSF